MSSTSAPNVGSGSDDPSGDYDPAVAGSAPHAAPVDGSDSLVTVVVPPGQDQGAIARALLEAAHDPADVQFGGDGFVVPASVAEAADLEGDVEVVKNLNPPPSQALGDTTQPEQLARIDRELAGHADVQYEDMTVADLSDAIKDRNKGRAAEDRILAGSTKADKVAALKADDCR